MPKGVLFLLLRALSWAILAAYGGASPTMEPSSSPTLLELPRIEVAFLDLHTFGELSATSDRLCLQANLVDLHGDDAFSQFHSGDALFQVSRDRFQYHFGGTDCRFVRLHPDGENNRWLAQELTSEEGCQRSTDPSPSPSYTMPARREPFVYILAIFSSPSDQVALGDERILNRVTVPAPGVLCLTNEILDDIRVAAFVIIDEPDPLHSPLEPPTPDDYRRSSGGDGRREDDSCPIM